MKENRDAIYVTLTITVLSLGFAVIAEYCEKINNLLPKADFIINCLLGIFSGAMLAMIIAIINYRVEKKKFLTERINFIGCLILELMPLNNLVLENGKHNLENEENIIKDVYYLMRDYVHMRPNNFQTFFPKSKIVNINQEIMDMIIELYLKVENLKRLIEKSKFGIINRSEIEKKIDELLKYLLEYESSCYTNILGRKTNELQSFMNIKYDYEAKMEF
jgi:hypothetical protein|nr:MAG TPA: hypothetical protein [Caudoviricetes sp.]